MELKGWNQLIYQVIQSNFSNSIFKLEDLYTFEKHFKVFYPENTHIQAKIRQVLQQLRDKNLITFLNKGEYYLNIDETDLIIKEDNHIPNYVYLLSNPSIPDWVKIGRTKSIDNRLNQLYNTSVPLPFNLEKYIETHSSNKSLIVEQSIHSIIDTINPSLRKDTLAYRREFFKLTVDQGLKVFDLVEKVININN